MIVREEINQRGLHFLKPRSSTSYQSVYPRLDVERLSEPYLSFYDALIGNSLVAPLNLIVECLIVADITGEDPKIVLNEDKNGWIRPLVIGCCVDDNVTFKYSLTRLGCDEEIRYLIKDSVEQILPILYNNLSIDLLFSENKDKPGENLIRAVRESTIDYFQYISGNQYSDEVDIGRAIMELLVDALAARLMRFAKISILLNICIEFKQDMLNLIHGECRERHGLEYGRCLERDIECATPSEQDFQLSKDLKLIVQNPKKFADYIIFSNENLEKQRYAFC